MPLRRSESTGKSFWVILLVASQGEKFGFGVRETTESWFPTGVQRQRLMAFVMT